LPENCCAVLELRQYTLKPGQRDVLIDLFEHQFVESQEALGMRIPGTFRDSARPDRFVWVRGFTGMETRRAGLTSFYGGPVWKEHRAAANATMIDSGNVLLLRPAVPSAGFDLAGERAPLDGEGPPARTIVATVHAFAQPVDEAFVRWFDQEALPRIAKAGATVLGRFVTEPATNTFPALPVREGENVFVWFAAYPDAAAAQAPLDSISGWREHVQPRLARSAPGAPERMVLEPTRRSLLR
jgi:hypothetical protein